MLNEFERKSCRQALGMCGKIMFKVEIFLAWPSFWRRSLLYAGDHCLIKIAIYFGSGCQRKTDDYLYNGSVQALTAYAQCDFLHHFIPLMALWFMKELIPAINKSVGKMIMSSITPQIGVTATESSATGPYNTSEIS